MEAAISTQVSVDQFWEKPVDERLLMSIWANKQYVDKYSWKDEDGEPTEVWPDTGYRTVKHVLGALGYTDQDTEFKGLVRLISQRKFIPGGRYLASSGRPFHQVNNCFTGDTRIITKHGVISLVEAYSYVDPTVIVRNRFGDWERGRVERFGKQEIYRVTFSNGDVVNTTKDHRWWQSDGTRVTTEELQSVPFSVVSEMPAMSAEGVRHGIVFGDGTLHRSGRYSYWEVVNPEKDQALVEWFEDEEREVIVGGGAVRQYRTIRQTQRGTKVGLQPAHYKVLPQRPWCDPEYARGFIAGLIATDGCVSPTGSVTIHQEGLAKARRIAEIAVLAGCVVNSVRVVSSESPYTGDPRELAQISIKPFSAPIILPSHVAKLNPNQRHRMMELGVESVEATGWIDEVYCVVAPESESFTLANGLITSNCFLYRCEDSREGWADVVRKAVLALSSGGGIGVVYSDIRPNGTSIAKTGGVATGPLSPANMVNEVARHVMQGGHRRSAIWGGLHWNHPDILAWVTAKDWTEEQKAGKAKDFNAPAPLDMTNISVILDSEFFFAYQNEKHPKHEWSQKVYWMAVSHMLAHGEPGFSIDVGQNAKENLRNAPVTGDTHVLTNHGYQPVKELVGEKIWVWTGEQWAPDVVFEKTQENAPIVTVEMTGGRVIRCEPSHEFLVERYQGAGIRRHLAGIERIAAQDLQVGDQLHVSYADQYQWSQDRPLITDAYTLGWIYGDGSFTKAGGAELTLCSDDSKRCLSSIGGYSSVTENDSRGYTRLYFGVNPKWAQRSKSQFPVELLADSHPRVLASFIAGLFDADGNWEPTQRRIRLASKHEGFLRDVARALEQLGIMAHVSKAGHSTYGQKQTYQLVIASDYMKAFANAIPTQRVFPDLEGYQAYRASAIKVLSVTDDGYEGVYCADVQKPEHSFMAEGVIISNCTEITSEDDSDVCNLGSLNLARIQDKEELEEAISLATLFLLAGTVYSDVPHEEVFATREKNRRLGLGLMGIHEWLLVRGYDYSIVPELQEWLAIYATSTEVAGRWADLHQLSRPIKTRAIAPNGTIGIIGETTTSAEPVFCVAYKRRFMDNDRKWKFTYVIDPTVHRLKEQYGIDPDSIEDAYTLAMTPEKRIRFQADLQEYVDHGISSTINLPGPTTDPEDIREFGEILFKYLPRLRGLTAYPDGARSGQPLTVSTYHEAIQHEGVIFEENEEKCVGGSCGV